MKTIKDVLNSDKFKKLKSISVEAERLKWEIMDEVERITPLYGIRGESLSVWEKRLEILDDFVEASRIKFYIDGKNDSITPFGFLQFEVRRARRTIEEHRKNNLTSVPT